MFYAWILDLCYNSILPNLNNESFDLLTKPKSELTYNLISRYKWYLDKNETDIDCSNDCWHYPNCYDCDYYPHYEYVQEKGE